MSVPTGADWSDLMPPPPRLWPPPPCPRPAPGPQLQPSIQAGFPQYLLRVTPVPSLGAEVRSLLPAVRCELLLRLQDSVQNKAAAVRSCPCSGPVRAGAGEPHSPHHVCPETPQSPLWVTPAQHGSQRVHVGCRHLPAPQFLLLSHSLPPGCAPMLAPGSWIPPCLPPARPSLSLRGSLPSSVGGCLPCSDFPVISPSLTSGARVAGPWSLRSDGGVGGPG